MCLFEHDVLDEINIEDNYVYFNGETSILLKNNTCIICEAGFIHRIAKEICGRTNTGEDITIPLSEIQSIGGVA